MLLLVVHFGQPWFCTWCTPSIRWLQQVNASCPCYHQKYSFRLQSIVVRDWISTKSFTGSAGNSWTCWSTFWNHSSSHCPEGWPSTHAQATHPTIEHSGDDIAGSHATPACDNWRLTMDLPLTICGTSPVTVMPIAGQLYCFNSSSSSSRSSSWVPNWCGSR